MSAPLLRVEHLQVHYHTSLGAVRAAEDVSFTLEPGERLGVVGESGSGKSTTALAILRLIRSPGRIEGGAIWLEDTNLLTLPEEQMRQVRLARIAMIPQGSMNSLNPVLRIRRQLLNAFRDHDVPLPRREARARIAALLQSVGLPPEVADRYPHELSGGMKQRACIAIAISLKPQLILADEPTSALDVVVQKQVMETLGGLQQELGAAVILVGHDMGLVAQFVDRVGIMYAGSLVEVAPVRQIFTAPRHPYTQLLIASLPSLTEKGAFRGIPGLPPLLRALPPGCAFHPRCPVAIPRCHQERPRFTAVGPTAGAACHLVEGGKYATAP
jgi:peptide/nickel transport system ATP-binding protein